MSEIMTPFDIADLIEESDDEELKIKVHIATHRDASLMSHFSKDMIDKPLVQRFGPVTLTEVVSFKKNIVRLTAELKGRDFRLAWVHDGDFNENGVFRALEHEAFHADCQSTGLSDFAVYAGLESTEYRELVNTALKLGIVDEHEARLLIMQSPVS